MISVKEARQLIIENITPLDVVDLSLEHSCGRIVAEDIFSPIDMPNFPQSSMDGYAFNYAGFIKHGTLQLKGAVAAGEQKRLSLQPHEAARIFTGAPLPEGADTVVMQEKITCVDDTILIKDAALLKGNHVRDKAAEAHTGELVFEKDSLLTPIAVGFLAGLGITTVSVYRAPVISIISTGNELQQPGMPLKYGQVYESNSIALKLALESVGIKEIRLYKATDDLAELITVLQNSLEESDMVLLTGGVSVGDYDFVVRATEHCGIEKIFHKVKQKPGKPLFFGKKENQVVFGLPGNPSSVFSCFYQYVMLALQQMKNTRQAWKQVQAVTGSAIYKPAGLTHFLKGYFDGNTVTALSGQESFRMRSFAAANCLIEIPEETTEVKVNEAVLIYLLN